MKKIVRKAAFKLPSVQQFIAEKEETIRFQSDAIVGLRQSVDRLESRNKLWEAEVRKLRGEGQTMEIIWPVAKQDVIDANWLADKKKPTTRKKSTASKPLIAWVVPPPGQVSGGHADIFRTIHYLESKGYTTKLYFYDALGTSSLDSIKETLKRYPKVAGTIYYNEPIQDDCDALFATNWYTAYPVYNFEGSAKKYYYVQDFEPYFDPVGAYSTLAENTYRFGLRGLTLGSWLSEKLSSEYGMECDYFELGTDNSEYELKNLKKRKKILFYARPVTPRRGFELGILSLEVFHQQHPEYEIHFAGWDVSQYDIPFPYKNHGILTPSQLSDLYNECAAGLVLSYTNMSLLPLEMLGCGCVPVINDSVHTRKAAYADYLEFSPSTPQAFADTLYAAVKNHTPAKATAMAEYTNQFQWDESNKKIESILAAELTTSAK